VAFAVGFDSAASGEEQGGDAQNERENCGGPEGDDDGAGADHPVILERPESESAGATGIAGENLIRIGRGIMLEIPAGFGRMAGLAVGRPRAGVIDEFAGPGVKAALKVIPFAGGILARCVEGEFVRDAVAANPEERGEDEWNDKKDGEDVEHKSHRVPPD